MKFSEILLQNNVLEKKFTGRTSYEIAVLSNIMTNQLNPVLEYVARTNDVYAKCISGDYDNIIQDSEKYKDKNLMVIIWEAANIVDGLQYRAELFNEEETTLLINNVKNSIDLVLQSIKQTPAVVITKFSSAVFNNYFIKKNNFDRICQELNGYLEEKISANCLLLDIDKIFARISIDRSVDLRNFYSSKALYTIEFFNELSQMINPYILSISGKSKKALVFDCDNTLWNGIVGEDGPTGIRMSATDTKGVFYEEIQYIAKALAKQGILIGINSKNNEHDVKEIFDTHGDMHLKENEIAVKRVNWNDKVTNLREISKELNIGVDSIVFVDDSDFEINLVNQYLPEVKTIQVPKDPYRYAALLRKNLSVFFANSISAEDKGRAKMYKEQSQRLEERGSFQNLDEYLRSLELEMTLFTDNPNIAPRIAQLTQKTNQFNLTTKRYTEAEITGIINSPDHHVYAFGLKDKFGDFGITGIAIVHIQGEKAEFDSFLMSCRVLGRSVEKKFIQEIILHLKEESITRITASYKRTSKNDQVSNFYLEAGLTEVQKENDTASYEGMIDDVIKDDFSYIKMAYER